MFDWNDELNSRLVSLFVGGFLQCLSICNCTSLRKEIKSCSISNMNCKDATVNRNVIARSSILMCFLDINLEFPNNLYLLQSYTISLARSAAFYISQTQFECTKFITQRLLHMGSIPHICQVIYTITI